MTPKDGRPLAGMLQRGTFLLAFLLMALATSASAMKFNANWDYSQSGGEGVETQKEFRQRYSLGAGTALSNRPSHALSASAGISYTRTRGEDSQGSTRRDRLSPNGQVSLVNDIFTAQLSGTTSLSTPDDHTDASTTSWNGTVGSTWDIPLFPHVRFNFGETTIEDDTGVFPAQTVKNKGLSLDWDLLLAQINYQYNTSETTTEGSDGRLESDSHFVRLDTGGTLWDNRVNFHLSQNFNKSTQEVHAGSSLGPVPFHPTEIVAVQAGVSDSTGLWPEDEIALSDLVGLQVNDRERAHLVLSLNMTASIDSLRVKFEGDYPAELFYDLQWELYLHDGVQWVLERELSAFPLKEGVDVQVGQLAREIMVVAVNDSGFPLTIGEVLPYRSSQGGSGSSSSSTSSYVTNFNLGYRITRDLMASGGVILNHSEFNDGAQENDRRSLSGSLRWIAHPAIIPSVGYNEGRTSQTGVEESVSRSYNFTLSTIPLPAVTLSFGTTYGEQFLGSQKTSASTRYTLSSRAAIYPDLSAAGLLSYGENESRDREGTWSESKVLAGRLNLNARLRRNLNADMTVTYFKNDKSSSSLQGGEVTTGLRYRPTNVISLRGAYSTFYGDETRSDSMTLGASWSILTTPKARVTFNASHFQEEESREVFSLLGSWNISRALSLWTRANYLIAEKNVYSFQVNLALGL